MSKTTLNSARPRITSTNFALNVALLIGGLFAALQPSDVSAAVAAGVTLVSFVGILRRVIYSFDLRRWLADSNTWVYLATIVITFVPSLPVELFEQLGNLFAGILGGNYQAVLLALFSLANIIYRLVIKK